MCGIGAIFAEKNAVNLSHELENMISRINHRGPDGRGVLVGDLKSIYSDSNKHSHATWGLAHVRLAILDLSSRGAQPMSREQCWISYNGEVYNFIEIREELKKKGYQFSTNTDTEVILYSYMEWGEDCVKRFIGMFAFVIVDLTKKQVFIARDRLGIKPLYLWSGNKKTAVVSEIKQLYALPEFRPEVNRLLLVDFLVDEVIEHEPWQCMTNNVIPLAPGHTLTWKLGSQPIIEYAQCYWKPSLQEQEMSWEQAVEETRHTFLDAMRIRLRADVKIGSCLSGGIDSSSIAGLMTDVFDQKVFTFSSCFNGFEFDEQTYIDEVGKNEAVVLNKVFPTEDGLINDFDSMVYHQDEPIVSSSIYAQWCVMKAARENEVKVMLDGQGGDEVFGGYKKYIFFALKELLRKLNLGRLSRECFFLFKNGDQRLFDFASGQRYLPKAMRPVMGTLGSFLTGEYSHLQRHVWKERMVSVNDINDHKWADLKWWSLPALLRYEDRNSMAHGVEARVPFVDHRLVELGLKIPGRFVLKNGQTKRVLTEAVGNALPELIKRRRTKVGFETPASVWMCNRFGRVLEEKIYKSSRIKNIIDMKQVKAGFNKLRAGDHSQVNPLFRIGALASWLERFEIEV